MSPGQYFSVKMIFKKYTEEEFEKYKITLKRELEILFEKEKDLEKEIIDLLGEIKYDENM